MRFHNRSLGSWSRLTMAVALILALASVWKLQYDEENKISLVTVNQTGKAPMAILRSQIYVIYPDIDILFMSN